MKQIDVMIRVLEEEGYLYRDELSRAFDDNNILEFYDPKIPLLTVKIYFNFKTGIVSNFYVEINRAFHAQRKEEISQKYKIKLRDNKIDSVLNHSK